MAGSEERMRVLKMIQDGVITAEDGIRLLDSLDKTSKNSSVNNDASLGRTAKYFRVRVTDAKSGKTRVNVRLPVSVINAGVKMGARFSPQVEGLDMQELMSHIRSGMIGKIVDVYDDEDGEHVEVFLE